MALNDPFEILTKFKKILECSSFTVFKGNYDISEVFESRDDAIMMVTWPWGGSHDLSSD